MLRLILALLYLLGLLMLRAWYSVVLAFIGVAVARGAYHAAVEGDTSDAIVGAACALLLLTGSFVLFYRAKRQLDRLRPSRDTA